MSKLLGKEIRLKFYMTRARIHAMTLSNEDRKLGAVDSEYQYDRAGRLHSEAQLSCPEIKRGTKPLRRDRHNEERGSSSSSRPSGLARLCFFSPAVSASGLCWSLAATDELPWQRLGKIGFRNLSEARDHRLAEFLTTKSTSSWHLKKPGQ